MSTVSAPAQDEVLADFRNRKQRFSAWLRRFAELDLGGEAIGTATDEGPTLRSHALQLLHVLETDVFRVAVLGEFSSGKSSLLNVLLREISAKKAEGVLPTDITPTNATITELFYRDVPSAAVKLRNNCVIEPTLAELPAFLVEPDLRRRKYPELANREDIPDPDQIVSTRLGLPSHLLSLGVEIIDTPGLGSVHADHGRIARECVAGVDAAIFLLSVNPPMGEREMAFLQYVLGFTDRLLFVQTKRDQGDIEERGELVWKGRLRWHQDRIAEVLGDHDAPIYVVSALEAAHGIRREDHEMFVRSGIPKLEEGLQRFLADVRGGLRITTWHRKAKRMLDLADLTLASRQDQLRARVGSLQPQNVRTGDYKQWEDARGWLEEYVSKLRRKSDEDLRLPARRISDRVWAITDREISSLSAEVLREQPDRRFQLERMIVRTIQQESGRILESIVDTYAKDLAKVVSQTLGDRIPEAMRQFQTTVDPRRLLEDIEVNLLPDQFLKSETRVVEVKPAGFIETIGSFFRTLFGNGPRTRAETVYTINATHAKNIVEHAVSSTTDDVAVSFRRHVDRVLDGSLEEMTRIERAAKTAEEEARRISLKSVADCQEELAGVTGQRANLSALGMELDEIRAEV